MRHRVRHLDALGRRADHDRGYVVAAARSLIPRDHDDEPAGAVVRAGKDLRYPRGEPIVAVND